MARAKDVVFSEMANRGRYHYAEQIIEEMYGHWYDEFFYSGNRASHEGQIARGERRNRGRDSEKVRVKNGKASREVDNEIFRGYAIPKTKDGNYIVESGNVMMVTNGDRHDPSLEMVIVLDDEYETFMATAKEVIYNEARYGDVHAAARVIEGVYWPGYARFYDAEAYRANAKYERNRKRSLRQRLEDAAATGKVRHIYHLNARARRKPGMPRPSHC